MIDLYAIINEGQSMQLYVRQGKNRKQMEALLNHILKKIQNSSSKMIKATTVHTYSIYYFGQASFTFILATEIKDRDTRMHNYLRIVADIFYDNYDERKFHYVLDRIMQQINRTEFGHRGTNSHHHGSNHQLEDQQTMLVTQNIIESKQRINNIVQQRNRQSRRAYVIITLLFLAIMVLGVIYLQRKWS